jgi:hypothetical protein
MPHVPDSPCLTQYENSDGVSDFPPIRKCDSTPDRDPTTNRYLRLSEAKWSPGSITLIRSHKMKEGCGLGK